MNLEIFPNKTSPDYSPHNDYSYCESFSFRLSYSLHPDDPLWYKIAQKFGKRSRALKQAPITIPVQEIIDALQQLAYESNIATTIEENNSSFDFTVHANTYAEIRDFIDLFKQHLQRMAVVHNTRTPTIYHCFDAG